MDFLQGIAVGFGSACLLFGYAYWAHFMRPTWIKPRGPRFALRNLRGDLHLARPRKFRRGPLTRTNTTDHAAR